MYRCISQAIGEGLVPREDAAAPGRKHFERNINQDSAAPEPVPYGARGGSSSLSGQATFQFAPGADDSASRWRSANSEMMDSRASVAAREEGAARRARRIVKPAHEVRAGPARAPFATESGRPPAPFAAAPEPSVRVARGGRDDLLARVAAGVAAKVGRPEAAGAMLTSSRLAAAGSTAEPGAHMTGYTGRLPAGRNTSARDDMRRLPIVR